MQPQNIESVGQSFNWSILLHKSRLEYRLKLYLSSVVLIWLALGFYSYLPYYKTYFSPETLHVLLTLGVSFTILAIPYHFLLPAKRLTKNRSLQLFETVGEAVRKIIRGSKTTLDTQSKTNLLFMAVKLFFLPLMISFFIGNYHAVHTALANLVSATHHTSLLTMNNFNTIIFPLLLGALLLIDVTFFLLGYATESRRLGNTLRSVDTTLLGWLVVFVCYPQFSAFATQHINWYASDQISFLGDGTTFIACSMVLILMGVFAASSFALGFKASNLTNRGIVSRGPYALIRHPAYFAKNLAWWVSIIPVFSLRAAISMALWSMIYFLRAITEERHLMKDPDYQEYCKKVKYRFIPGVI